MARSRRFKVLVVSVASLLAAGPTMARAAAGAPWAADRAFAEEFGRRGVALDPVLSALSTGRLVQAVATIARGQVEPPAVPVGFAFRGSQLVGLDVTNTSAGKEELDGFLARLRGRGVAPVNDGYKVYSLPSIREAEASTVQRGGVDGVADGDGPLSSALIVPVGTTVEFVGAVFEDGQLHAKTVVSAAARPQSVSNSKEFSAMAAPSDSASFVRAGGVGCMHRKQNNTAWYDPCQEFWQLENDRDGIKDYFASQLWGTGKSKSVWKLNGLEVFARQTDNTPGQEWVDWDPGADADIDCQPQSVEVSYAGASVGITKQHCEMWDISKHADVRFSNWWRGSAWRTERETAMVALTKTKAEEFPHQTFDFDFYAR